MKRGSCIEHYHDTPRDRPLLSSYEPSSKSWWCQFGYIDGDLRWADSDAQTVDNATNNEHGNILRRRDDNTSNAPDNCADHNRFLSPQEVGDKTRDESAKPTTTSHGRGDTALNARIRTRTWSIRIQASLIKVATIGAARNASMNLVKYFGNEVALANSHSRHGRNIETK